VKKVIVMRGCPGSGKSTYAKTLNGLIFSADQFFETYEGYKFDASKLSEAHGSCLREFTYSVVEEWGLLIVDNTNINVQEIAPYIALANAFGFDHEILTLNTNPETSAEQCVHGVPAKKVRQMYENLERAERSFPKFWKHRRISRVSI
jgi:predicted kinase